MKRIFFYFIFFFIEFNLVFCDTIAFETKDYKEILGNVRNPDRGWYYQVGSNHGRVSIGEIRERGDITLMRVYFSLKNFQNTSIDKETLILFDSILKEAKKINIKIIPQFYYHWGDSKDKRIAKLHPSLIKSGRWLSPSSEIILKHVDQISEIINLNKNSISYIHAGFLGSWGEWHSDQYGDGYKVSSNEFRKILIKRMLEKLDKDIFIALRYASDHRKMSDLDGYERLGLHNDCPNMKVDDYPKFRAHELVEESPVDGETCQLPPKTSYNCKSMINYFKKYQFDSHNESNWSGAILRWSKGGCLQEIENKLGYRFVLKGSKFVDGYLYFKISNEGWGKSFKSRTIQLKVNEKIYKSDIDVKKWKPGKEYIEKIFIGDQKAEFGELIIEDNILLANTNGNKIFIYNN